MALLEKCRYLTNRSGDFPQVILIVPSHVPNRMFGYAYASEAGTCPEHTRQELMRTVYGAQSFQNMMSISVGTDAYGHPWAIRQDLMRSLSIRIRTKYIHI